MSDDIEALRNICNQVMDDEPRKQAIAALGRVETRIDALHKSQGYVYIGKDGKAISARELEDDRDSLRIALDDRYAADQRAAKAIFAETGRTAGFPSVKDVVGFYVAEVENWKSRAQQFQRERAELADKLNGTPCAEIRWQYERDSLRAQLDRAKEAVEALLEAGKHQPIHMGINKKAHAILAELSADAPAQREGEVKLKPGWLLDDVRKAAARLETKQQTQISDEVVAHVYGEDCPKGMVQVEFVGVSPKLKQGDCGWRPSNSAFLDVWVDGERFYITAGNVQRGDGSTRRGLHIIGPIHMDVDKHSVNALDVMMPLARPSPNSGA